MIKNKYNRKSEYLPLNLIQNLNEFLKDYNDYRSRNNFLRCIGIIFCKQIVAESDYDGYVPTGSAFWRTVFSHDYHEKVLNPLLEQNIIQSKKLGFRNNSARQYRGIVDIWYRINPELLADDCEFMQYNDKGKILTSESLEEDGIEYDIIPANDRNFKISILKDKAITFINNEAERICKSLLKPEYLNNFPNNYQITYKENINGVLISQYRSVGSAKILAQSFGKQLFYYNNDFYMADMDEFLTKRIESTTKHYLFEISKASKLPVLNKRSKTNLRVHNHLTNFPSAIMHFLKLNNQGLVQYDLQTSQFLLFANILNTYLCHGEEFLLKLFKHRLNQQYLKRLIKILKTYQLRLPSCGVDISNPHSCQNSGHDVLDFIRDVFFSDFYEVINTELGLPERAVAKQAMFKMLFKSDTKSDVFIDKLKTRYPLVIAVIDAFKTSDKAKVTPQKNEKPKSDKKDRQSNFSVFLQCVEAEIYIDNILLPLREQDIPCFTRHDSVVVAWSYQDQVQTHIKSVFAGLGFRYNQKIGDMSVSAYTDQELEENGIVDYWADRLYLDDLTYEGEYIPYTMPEENDFDDWDDIDPDLLERLEELGIQSDYSDLVDQDFLADLLPSVNDEQGTILELELENQRQGMSCFQSETNELIRAVVRKYTR